MCRDHASWATALGTLSSVAPSRSALLVAGRYRLGELLGTGGMADVYDAVDERLDRPVAVKVLRPEMASREDVRLRFEAEARSAARLIHPNVVGVFDSGEDEDGTLPYLVMERLPGETLADRMQAAGEPDSDEALDTDWVLRTAGDVLLALGAAHSAGLVHRDVKPANVLIGVDGCAKVADFGIAKSLEVAAAADLTSTNQLVGTPAYVAPERILGKPASPQSDLYAVGVLLYEALAGRKPFAGDTPVATAYAIQHETPPSLASLRPDLPPSVVAAVEKAMDRDPTRRFSSAAEMAAALGIDDGAGGLFSDPTVLSMPKAAAATSPGTGDTQVLPVSDAVPVSDLVDDGRGRAPSTAATPGAAPRPRPPLLEDRQRLMWIALVGVAIALLLLGLAAASGGDGDGDGASPARAALASELRDAGEALGAEDGDAAAEAAQQVGSLADEVDDGGGGEEATALLRQLVSWRDGGGLTAVAADRLAGLVRRVPGVDGAAYTAPTTTAPPTTAAPPPPERQDGDGDGDQGDGGKRKKDDDD